MVDVKVTNPVTYLKLFLKKLLKNEGIDIRLKIKPLTVIAMVSAVIEVKEVISFDKPAPMYNPAASNSAQEF